ncbi:hypothetical protein RSAG8_01000, partial [Rhizoctonia solani AG-8 WAC10335]
RQGSETRLIRVPAVVGAGTRWHDPIRIDMMFRTSIQNGRVVMIPGQRSLC